ncbi:NFACT-R_1 domain-containing protein, partial [Haematococcus lacustris]
MVQRQADMITANLYRVTPGASHVMCEDWDTGHTVRLELDPLKTPVQAAEALYKRARKLRRSLAAVQPLLAAAQAELEYL